eukprot:TRINITY_DN4804_c0_g1_i1.p1 TRINITY_DN4804_c0_g1~~TRINITY_DN4804_c0_g1_i1.p1  ORF type:complete len:236 (-),score=13.02 TRINITY_DN4804_c0_g1_i1:457-1164(-)
MDNTIEKKLTLKEILHRIWSKKIFIIATVMISTICAGGIAYKLLIPEYYSEVFIRVIIPHNSKRQADLASYRFNQFAEYCNSIPNVSLNDDGEKAIIKWKSTSPESAKKMADAGFAGLQQYIRNEKNNPLIQHRKAVEEQLATLKTAIDALEKKALNSRSKSKELRYELDALYTMYKSASKQLVAARIDEAGSSISLQVISAPELGHQPLKTKKEFIVGASAIVSSVLAVLIVLL